MKLEPPKRARRECAGLEREPERSQVCQDMPKQHAAEFGSCGGELRRITASFPPPSWRSWGRGGDVSAPPRPSPRGAEGILPWGAPPGQPPGRLSQALLHQLRSLRCSVRPSLLCRVPSALLSAGVPRTQHLSGPRAPLCSPLGLACFQAPSRSDSHASNCR